MEMTVLTSLAPIPEGPQILLWSSETGLYSIGVRDGDAFLIGTLRYSPDLFSQYMVLVP